MGAKIGDLCNCILGFCDDHCLLSPVLEDLQILLDICGKFGKDWAISFNILKSLFIVFGTNRLNDTRLFLNNSPLNYTSSFKYLGLEFNYNLNMSSFFLKKMESVRKSFFSLNSFGLKAGGVSPHLQSLIFKSFCISQLLYGLEIMFINKKTIKALNLVQNSIVRYMTGLAKNAHISDVLIILKLLNIKTVLTACIFLISYSTSLLENLLLAILIV